jgi:hypothetical protein
MSHVITGLINRLSMPVASAEQMKQEKKKSNKKRCNVLLPVKLMRRQLCHPAPRAELLMSPMDAIRYIFSVFVRLFSCLLFILATVVSFLYCYPPDGLSDRPGNYLDKHVAVTFVLQDR